MKWYFALNELSLISSRALWEPMILAALHSARRNTSLLPHMLYDGNVEDAFIQRIKGAGVNVIRHRVSFFDSLEKNSKPFDNYVRTAAGAFLRTEIPLIEKEDDFVIYTDCDVIFNSDLGLDFLSPELFACAPEFNQNDFELFNSGVMLMNIPALRRDVSHFLSWISDNHMKIDYDQDAYRVFYANRVSELPVEYNWKPYWGVNANAKIIHFHGVKPSWAKHLLENPEDKAVPVLNEIFHWNVPGYRHYVPMWTANAQAGESGIH